MRAVSMGREFILLNLSSMRRRTWLLVDSRDTRVSMGREFTFLNCRVRASVHDTGYHVTSCSKLVSKYMRTLAYMLRV
jgi:hypothetical protein